jgi:hypothetical protein
MPKKPKAPTEITSIRHTKDTRVNIPTEELRDFVAEDEKAPKAMLYPRDPSLDPQLVWRGKDEQDAAALEVPVVPIVRLQARPARHAEVDREQSGHQGRHDARGDRRGDFAPRRHRNALRQAVRGR